MSQQPSLFPKAHEVAMRKRFYLAVIVLAILLLALGGLVVRLRPRQLSTRWLRFDRGFG
jgi:hypothetical protein